MKILHLSDLHLDSKHLLQQRVVLKALFADIQRTVTEQGPYDLAFFTGDLIAKGNYSAENAAAAIDEFLLPLLHAAELNPERLFLVPGNHDVDLKSQSRMLASAQKSLATDEQVAEYLSEAMKAKVETGLEGFNAIAARLGSRDSETVIQNNHYSAYIVDVSGVKVGIAAFNTAWHATGAPLDGDYGRLWVSRMQLDEVVAALASADVRVALMHHSVSWLCPKDSANTHRQLLIHFDAVFHGHNHEPQATGMVGASNSYFVSNAGCLYQSRDYFNGYCSVTYSAAEKAWRARAREYFETRQAFDVAPRFGPGGEATFHRVGAATGETLVVTPSHEYTDSVHERLNSRLLPALVSDVAPKGLKSIFVEPLLSRISQRMLKAKTNESGGSIFVTLRAALQEHKHIVFLGSKDSGKTTILHRICQQAVDLGTPGLPAFAACVNLDVAGETQASLVEAIVSFGGNAYRKAEVLRLLKRGDFVVCFDNLNERNVRQLKSVREFCETFQGCRFFFSMFEDIDYSLSAEQVPKLTPSADVLYVHPFGRKETRLLTQNWFGESEEACANKVDDVLSLLTRLHVPRTPFIISALLWIREKGTQFSPVNQAEILDALVDGVMEKLTETKDRSRIDSTIKRHFLASLAEHLHETGQKRIPALELERFTTTYFASRGLPAPTAPFLQELKAKGILFDANGDVAFMFEAIRAFFLSIRLHENPALLEKALSKEAFLELGEELDYYTGRHRDRTDVLRRSIDIVREFEADAQLDVRLSDFDLIRHDGRAAEPGSERKLREATSRRPTAKQRQDLLESVDDSFTAQPMSVSESRPKYQETGIGRYLEALRIGSSILRNSELIGDVPLKQSSYSVFADGWCRILIGVTNAIEGPESGSNHILEPIDQKRKDPILRLLEGMLPAGSPGMARQLKKLIVPNVVVSLALESIGTPKLQKIMEAHNHPGQETVQRLLDVFLMIDLRTPRWIEHFSAFLHENHKNRFVCELVFSKLFQIYMLGRIRPSEEDAIKGLLAQSITLMLGESRTSQVTRIRGNFLTNLSKKRLTGP
jgi:predicted MPP superfamily phosphohydrolase